MNKITKANFKKLGLALALTLVMTLGMSISVFAATGAINGYTTRASSTIRQQTASASTSYDYNGSVSVSSTYSYVNVNTLATGTCTKNNGHYSRCSVAFSAPSNCHSVKIVSSHKVLAFGQTWSTKTSATY